MPQRKPPKGIPANNIATRDLNKSFGEYSAARDTTLGIAPPKPRPVKKRNSKSSLKVVARPVSSAKIPKTIVEITTGHLRPQRSAIGPVAIAAIIKPTRLAERIGPKALNGIFRLSEMDGARVPAI